VPNGAKVPGTPYQLDPVHAAFNLGAMIRWLDFNDTWLAAEWGHPSDNLGAILMAADWVSRNAVAAGKPPLVMHDVLTAMIKAHEIQGCLALENSFNKVGLDHVVLVKVASTAVVSQLLGLSYDESINALSLAWVDGQSAAHVPPCAQHGLAQGLGRGRCDLARGTLALIARTGEMGYPSAAHCQDLGFYDVLFKGNEFKFQRPYESYCHGARAFKISFPAEFHSQTAVEAAMTLQRELERLGRSVEDIKKITIRTHEAVHPHHRQEGAPSTTGRSRPLHPVHGGGARSSSAALRPRTTRITSPTDRASTAARQDRVRRGQAVHALTTTISRSARSPTASQWNSTTARS
jgi:2-methylcitrate dehydratase